MKVKVAQSCPTLCNPMDYTVHSRPEYWSGQPFFPSQGSNPGFPHSRWIRYQLSHKGSPKNTGVGSLSLLQWIFPTQESNQGLLHCRQILYELRHQESPRIPEWIAYPFSNGSSQPRNQTGVSCIAGGFLPTELSGNPQIYLHMQIMCISSSPVSLQIQTRT